MTALRVLEVRNTDLYGGPERLIVAWARHASADVEHVVASFGAAGAPHPFLDEARRAGLATVLVEQSGSYDPRIVGRLRRAAEATRADVLVGHDYKANAVLRVAARGAGLPRAAVVHGYTAATRRLRLFEALDRRALRRADAVVAVTPAMGERLRAAGVDATRLLVAENGVDVEAVSRAASEARSSVRAEWGLLEDDLVVMSVGRLSSEKGHAHLLAAFGKVADPRARLVLVGDGPMADSYRATAAGLGPGRVRFAGWRPDPERCLGAADVVVLPSEREGLPLALLEAMAAGLPVVATEVGGMPDALGGGACGVLVPPRDPAALARAVSDLLSDPGRRRGLGEAARARARERYDGARQARVLEDLWRRLHASRHPSR